MSSQPIFGLANPIFGSSTHKLFEFSIDMRMRSRRLAAYEHVRVYHRSVGTSIQRSIIEGAEPPYSIHKVLQITERTIPKECVMQAQSYHARSMSA